jgi:hypothetical protein
MRQRIIGKLVRCSAKVFANSSDRRRSTAAADANAPWTLIRRRSSRSHSGFQHKAGRQHRAD